MTSEHGTRCQVGLALPTRKISIEGGASPVLPSVFLLGAVKVSLTEEKKKLCLILFKKFPFFSSVLV